MARKARSGWGCSHSGERILHESALTVHESLPDTTAWGAIIPRVFEKLRQAAGIEVRTGYQDEKGFHHGIKPARNEIQWPPVW